MNDDLIEKIARAICVQNLISTRQPTDAATIDAYWQSFKAEARAALSAIEKSGTHLVVETRLADEPVAIGNVPTIIPIPRPIVKVLRREAKDARSGDMVVNGVDIDMAELLEEAANEIARLRSELSARPPIGGETG